MGDALTGNDPRRRARWSHELWAEVRTAAMDAGFHLAGIAGAAAENAGKSLGAARFAAWVEAGRAGEMEYLKRRDGAGRLLREDVRVAFPWAGSVVVCALNYSSDLPLSIDPAPSDRAWIGRYAWSGKRQAPPEAPEDPEAGVAAPLVASDYHDVLLGGLKQMEARLRGSIGDAAAADLVTRCYVDTGPIVEREFAAKAGVGWIGKNTCVLNQELGSWLLLGVIVTSLALPADTDGDTDEGAPPSELFGMPAADRCGSCTRCIDACPTAALVAPREMDAARCIAYLTIEKKGTIAPEFRAAIGRQVFGCDICQDVCPWNQRHRGGGNRSSENGVTPHIDTEMQPRQELVNPQLAWLAAMDGKQFKRWFKGSPIERTGLKRLRRNLAIAMGNSGEHEFLPQLRAWAHGDDAVLAEAALWALAQLGGQENTIR